MKIMATKQQKIYSYSLKEHIKLETDQPITVPELIKHLQALEQIAKQSSRAFGKLTNTEIIAVDLLIDDIEKGSLKEDIILKLLFKDKENLDLFIEQTRNLVIENPMETTLGALVLGGLVAYGIYRLRKKSSEEGRSIIINNYGTIIANAAGKLNISEEAFKQAIEGSVDDKQKLAKNAQKFVQMAKSEAGNDGSIIFGDNNTKDNLEIPANVVAQVPVYQEIETSEDKTTKFENITLQIRTLDRDKYTGWLAYIEGAFTQRLPLEIPITTDLNVLARQEAVKATVTLVYREKGDKIERKKIVLNELHTK